VKHREDSYRVRQALDRMHPMTADVNTGIDPLPVLLGFTRALKAAGVPVAPDCDQQATYWAGRPTLCAGPDDLTHYDQVFEAWFDPRGELPRRRESGLPTPAAPALPTVDGGAEAGDDDDEGDVLRAAATRPDVLRHRDVASLDAAERQRLTAMFATLRPTAPVRHTARHQRWHRGHLDASRTMRDSLRRIGEPGDLAWRRRRVRSGRVVLLVDVSGSMSAYADALLRLSHRFVIKQPRAEVVVVFSDGWEPGDAALFHEQMARLHRIAHHVVWVNPHRGKPGYEPMQQGIAAALPYVDDFVAGHSLATFEERGEVVGGA